MKKQQKTRQTILETALDMASMSSLSDLTIGSLADALGMSKSGLFAHFNSKENLQLAVLDYAEARFSERVINPTLDIEDPLARLIDTANRWLDWYESLAGNCIFITAMVEMDDQQGAVHDQLHAQMARLVSYLQHRVQVCIDHGSMTPDTDPKQFVFEWFSLYTGSQLFKWLALETRQRDRFKQAFDGLMRRHTSRNPS